MNDSLLPFNATPLELAIEAALAQRTDTIPLPVSALWDPQRCPEALLPWLAWALSVDTWDSDWPVSRKRAVIADSVRVHRAKGTVAAVERVLAALGVIAELNEWFDYGGAPYTFRLTAWVNTNLDSNSETLLNPALYRALKRAVDNVKPVRSHYDFRVGVAFSDELQFAGAFSASSIASVTATPRLDIHFPPPSLTVGAGFIGVAVLRLSTELQ